MSNKQSIMRNLKMTLILCFCIICLCILMINTTLIIKTMTDKDNIPSIGGIFPLIVLSDSMHPKIQSGDLIICQKHDVNDIRVGDIVSFYGSSKKTLVTHRVTDIVLENEIMALKTKGDANNTPDEALVKADDVVGVYKTRVPYLGHVVLFMQSKAGILMCSVVPLVGYILYMAKSKRKKDHDIEMLKNELDFLKAKYSEN